MDSLHNSQVRLEDWMPLLRETLSAGQTVTFSPRGTSMLPLLRQGKDTVTLTALTREPRKHDIVLYQRNNGQYVLHRIVKTGETCTLLGDNQFQKEPGIHREQMIALVRSVTRSGKTYSMNGLPMWSYSRFWYFSRPLRRMFRRIWGGIRRIIG